MTEVLEQWAKEEACKRVNARVGGVHYTTDDVGESPAITELTLTIQKHEKPPVDPDLLIAREAVARWCDLQDLSEDASKYRTGEHDVLLKNGAAYLALKIAREQGAI